MTGGDRLVDQNLEQLVQQTLSHFVDLELTSWEELTELASPEPMRSAEQRKAAIVAKLYDHLRKNPDRPDARDLDIRCSEHPISKLGQRPVLHGDYARLYRLLDGLASRLRNTVVGNGKQLTELFEQATSPCECQTAVDTAMEAGFLIRNPATGKLNHNRNLLRAKQVFAAYVEASRRINRRGFPNT